MSEFQRLLQMTDALQKQLHPADVPLTFAEDAAIQAKALAVFESQGVSITPAQLQAATQALDAPGRPIVPLVAPVRRRRWWLTPAQRRADEVLWERTFQRIRRARHRAHVQARTGRMNTTPLSPADVTDLAAAAPRTRAGWTREFDHGPDVPQRIARIQDNFWGDRGPMESPPLLQCLFTVFYYLPQKDALEGADLALAQWLVEQEPTTLFAKLDPKTFENDDRATFLRPRGLSVLDHLCDVSNVPVITALAGNWPRPRRWNASQLWQVLVHPLRNEYGAQLQCSVEGGPERLEAVVHLVMDREPKAQRHHARVIQEAIALHHPHSAWLRQWLTPAGARP